MLRQAAFAVAAISGLIGPVAAAEISDGDIIAREIMDGTFLSFEVKGWPEDARGVMLRIVGPKDFLLEESFGKSVPQLDLAKYGKLPGGFYQYEIRGGTGKAIERRENFNNGRGKLDVSVDFVSFQLSGRFRIAQGQFKEIKQYKENKSEETVIEDDKTPDTDSGKPSVPSEDNPRVGIDVKDQDG